MLFLRESLFVFSQRTSVYLWAFSFLTLASACFRTPLDSSLSDSGRSGPSVENGVDLLGTGSDAVAISPAPADGLDNIAASAEECAIGSLKYKSGAANPKNACQSCQPSLTSSSWSSIAVIPGCLAAGWAHSCVLLNGGAWCWGMNIDGQLGNGSTVDSKSPVQVKGLSAGAQGLAAGFRHTCAAVDGGVECWGANYSGQLGDGSNENSLTPVRVKGISAEVQIVVAGENHTCALISGAVWCWGVNESLELGSEVGLNSTIPVQVQNLPPGIRAIAAGTAHTCALSDEGVWCWGDNTFNQLGHDFVTVTLESPDPVKVEGLSGTLRSIAATEWSTCVLTSDGVQCWGHFSLGPLLDPATSNSIVTIQGFTSDVKFITARMEHACAIISDTRYVACWGDNSYGDLGSEEAQEGLQPFEISGNITDVQTIAAGDYHTCSVVANAVSCWGRNSNGQLGDGTTADSSVPVEVQGLPASN